MFIEIIKEPAVLVQTISSFGQVFLQKKHIHEEQSSQN